MKSLSFFLLLLLTIVSCIPNKQVVYFPNPEFSTEVSTEIHNPRQIYRLQPRDVLSVRILTLDSESAAYFNIQPNTGFMNLNPAGFYLNGYSIDEEGNIFLPEVGPVNVLDLTLNEAQSVIADAIGEYLSTATVIVKLTSFKITVLGEVNNPGYYYVYNDQANLLEGLGLASDLTEFGNRENITLIRQTEDGSEVVLLNLKDPDILSSKYYFLQPNDVIYVQPLKAKNTRSNLSTFTILSVLFGAISSTILLLRYVND
ncbi:polysaccharide export outer membrane protein [Catalinimonas alkaloidigena]|uniref:polysaccharide biosynthesis/export family protein n=1 Tax=Catalinimonas alkaloidigena TaxID=1075417 RepID=UPI002405B48E|nr:polysaccharide biosynthesis/export family protein [Catalinimonas alkaloidigena]MDF9799660.1 polysaccharide export outer membrane protein [Catalinimonas alkaloidigena]